MEAVIAKLEDQKKKVKEIQNRLKIFTNVCIGYSNRYGNKGILEHCSNN